MTRNSRSPPIKKSKNNNKNKTNIPKDKKERQEEFIRKQEVNGEENSRDTKGVGKETRNKDEDPMNEDEDEWFADPEDVAIGLYARVDIYHRKDVKIEGYTPFTKTFGEGDAMPEAVQLRNKFEPDKRGKVH